MPAYRYPRGCVDNLTAIAQMRRRHPDVEIVLIQIGEDNLSATFSPELTDVTVYGIDVAASEEIPRKGGTAITNSDVLVRNKSDLAPTLVSHLMGWNVMRSGCAATSPLSLPASATALVLKR
mgnify:FL=1